MTKKDADASVLVRFAYTRDAAGNPIKIERESGLGTFYYQYDALQRLNCEGQFVNATRQYAARAWILTHHHGHLMHSPRCGIPLFFLLAQKENGARGV